MRRSSCAIQISGCTSSASEWDCHWEAARNKTGAFETDEQQKNKYSIQLWQESMDYYDFFVIIAILNFF